MVFLLVDQYLFNSMGYVCFLLLRHTTAEAANLSHPPPGPRNLPFCLFSSALPCCVFASCTDLSQCQGAVARHQAGGLPARVQNRPQHGENSCLRQSPPSPMSSKSLDFRVLPILPVAHLLILALLPPTRPFPRLVAQSPFPRSCLQTAWIATFPALFTTCPNCAMQVNRTRRSLSCCLLLVACSLWLAIFSSGVKSQVFAQHVPRLIAD